MQLQSVAVERHAAAIDLYLQERLRILETVARSYSLEELSQEKTLQNIYRVFGKSYPNAFVDIGVIDQQGYHLAYYGPYPLKHINYRHSEWFKMVMSNGSYVSDVFLGYRKVPHLIIAIKRNENNRRWILRATINSRNFDTLVQTGHMDRSTVVFIINRKGLYQTTSPLGDVLTSSPIVSPKPHQGVSNNELMVNGIKTIRSTIWLNNNRWMMVVQQNKDQILAALYRAVAWGALVILIAVGLVVITTVIATSHLTNRIKLALQQRDELYRNLLRTAKLASLGELATGMAHEINNPLAILRAEQTNIEDQIAEANLSEETRKALMKSTERCKRQIDRCGGITAKMLQFGRTSASSPQRVRIAPIIQDIISMLNKQATIRNIALRLNLEKGLPDVYVDPNEFEQVLINLINNAFYAINDGGVITVTAAFCVKEIEIRVADNGKGIEKENLEKVFLPFFTTKPVGEGTGMGLSVCYGIVRGWGGTITADSEVGHGSVFTISLPVKTEQTETFTDVLEVRNR
jgi:two-component system NtrC family sensor kinase